MTSVKKLPDSEINNIQVVVREQTVAVVARDLCRSVIAGIRVRESPEPLV